MGLLQAHNYIRPNHKNLIIPIDFGSYFRKNFQHNFDTQKYN